MRGLLFLLLGLSACHGTDKIGGTEDTGDTGAGASDDTGVTYEDGCITVDGQGGYAWINDAIAVASEGSTIELCSSEAHVEAVVVDKGVSIEGAGDFLLVAPEGQLALDILADGASVEGISVQSEGAAVQIGETLGVTLRTVAIDGGEGVGVSATDADDLLLSDLSVSGCATGGVVIDGGSGTVTGSTFDGNTAYGLAISGGALVGVEGCTFRDTAATDPDALEDGVGLFAEGGSEVSTSGNTFDGSALINLYSSRAELDMDRDQLTGALIGVQVDSAALTMADVQIDDAEQNALYVSSRKAVSLSGVQITGDPDVVTEVDIDDWGSADFGLAGTAVVLSVDDLTIEGMSVEGYNNGGMFLAESTSGLATIDGLTLTDTGWMGLYVESITATISGLQVSGVAQLHSLGSEQCASYWARNAGVIGIYADLDFIDPVVQAPDGYGLSSYDGDISLDNPTITGASCSEILNFQGSLDVTGGDLTGVAGDYPGVFLYEATGSHFDGVRFGEPATTATSLDVQLYGAQDTTLKDCTFKNGDYGLWVEGSDADVSGTTFYGHAEGAVVVVDTSDPVLLDDLNVSAYTTYGVVCSGGTHLDISNSMVWQATGDAGVYGEDCVVSLDNVDLTEPGSQAIVGYGGTWDLGDVSVSGTGSTAIYLTSYYSTVSAALSQVSVASSSGSYGIDISGSSGSVATVEQITLDQAGDVGLKLEDVDFTASDITVNGGDESGIVFEDSTGSASTIRVSGAGEEGVYIDGSDVTISGLTVSSAALHGLLMDSGILDLQSSSLTGSGSSGVFMLGGDADLSHNTITGNTTFGMECAGVSVGDCDDNDLSGNLMGEQTGCPSTCGEEAVPGDTGDTGLGGDTGDTGSPAPLR